MKNVKTKLVTHATLRPKKRRAKVAVDMPSRSEIARRAERYLSAQPSLDVHNAAAIWGLASELDLEVAGTPRFAEDRDLDPEKSQVKGPYSPSR